MAEDGFRHFKAIIENKFGGLLYDSEIFQPLHTGMVLKAYVKQIREDGKIDLVLQKLGFEKVDDFSKTLLEYIREHDGYTPLNDKSPADDIYAAFGVSKKTFKKAVGDLYKNIWLCYRKTVSGWHPPNCNREIPIYEYR